MTDTPEAFADLVRLKREFYGLNETHAQWCMTLPSTDRMTEDQHARMRQTQTQLTELAMRIHRHQAFEGLPQMERYELDTEASKRARAGG